MKAAVFQTILLLALLGGNAQDALADAPPGMTKEEVALAAPWCRYTQTIGHDRRAYQRMLEMYGFGFSHMHHYCWAQVDAMRLYKRKRGPDYASARRGIGNCNYVLNRTDPSFIFWKDTMVLKIRLTDLHVSRLQAIQHAQELVKGVPEFADGYTILADLLFKANRSADAHKVLAQGAEQASDKERFQRLRSALLSQ